MREYWNNLSQNIKPFFHELSAYLIALAFCWLFFTHIELRQGLFIFFSGFESWSPFFIFLGLVLAGGLLLSLLHVFIRRKRSSLEKVLIGCFLLTACAAASFFMASELLVSRSPLWIVPVWNILMSLLLLIQLVTQKYVISDEEASFLGVLVTTVILVGLLWTADSFLQLSWATTLSICIFYTTSIVYLLPRIARFFKYRLPDLSK